ncbi:recombinase family protein [Streptomyces sp. NPDC051582]|uniref:recombinase family protein n=1 Tax=Streptomyces sp. NPDC051582 TaxID=3155167 RepID=UPI00341D35E7
MPSSPALPNLSPAAYLRCYPRDPAGMRAHHEVMHRFAARLGMPAPVVYVDDGVPCTGLRPQFEQLTRAVAAGRHRVLLVPGPWVFSPDDARARTALRMLTAAGCRRILQLPRSAAQQGRRPTSGTR